jgi:hypothetical protein
MCHLALMPAAVGRYSVVGLLRTQLRRAPYFTYGGVGSSPTVRSRIGSGVLSSPGLFMPLFSGVRGTDILRTSPKRRSMKFAEDLPKDVPYGARA